MRIGFVVYGGLGGTSGGYRYDRQLVDYLRACGDTVEVISLRWRSYWRCLVDGVSPTISSRLDRPVDVLVEDELCHPSLWRQNRRLGRPGAIVALVHNIQSDNWQGRLQRVRRWVEQQYLESVDGTIATSKFTHDRVTALAPDSGESHVAPPAGRIEGRACSEKQVRQRATEGPLRITFVGNLVPRKDPKTLLSAVARTVARHDCTDWQLTVVGSHEANPAYAAAVVDWATELGIDDSVEFTGEIADDELAATLEASHVLCVPSRYEAFGMVYLEAMEYGVVPIASQRGGASEFITDGENGALADPGDVDRIATLLADWERDRNRLAELAVSALDSAAAHPGWDETLAEARSFLKRVSTGEPRSTDRTATETQRGQS